jgi:hypothetical protein
MAICKQCGQEFEAKRVTAQYCSAKCRKLAFQADAKISVPIVSVPVISDTVTDKPKVKKFGKDIKCFEDLPPDVQRDILAMSRVGNDNPAVYNIANLQQRTVIAINYQHLFPHRYYAGNAQV